MGSSFDALIAGYNPEPNPTKKHNKILAPSHGQGITKAEFTTSDVMFPMKMPKTIPTIPPI